MLIDSRVETIALALLLLVLSPATAQPPPLCSGRLPVHAELPEEVAAHRLFTLPQIEYPANKQLDAIRLYVILVADERGRVKCVLDDGRLTAPSANEQRRKLLNSVSAWRYKPFTVNGVRSSVRVAELIHEVRRPSVHFPLPDVPQNDVQITLERTGCFGSCPGYRVDIYGNGAVVYEGRHPVDIKGRHTYTVSRDKVAQLIEAIRVKDIWSVRGSFRTDITDLPTYTLTLRFGTQESSIEDYGGESEGMPREVTEIQNEIDAVAESNSWIYLSKTAISRLEDEHFDFQSREAGRILISAIANPVTQMEDESAILDLINRGAPLTYFTVSNALGQDMTLLQLAQAHGYTNVAAALFAPPHPWQTREQ